MKEPKPIPLGAQLISLEIALVALLQVMARTEPAAAQRVVVTMRDIASLVPEKHFPGVSKKVEQYVETIEAEMSHRSEFSASNALSLRKRQSALQ